jgi:hypothetical protein
MRQIHLPISRESLSEAYGGEYRITLGQKTYDTIRVKYRGRKEDATYGEDYINQDGLAILVTTYLTKAGINDWKVENRKQSPTLTLNDETYHLATETHLGDTATYR